MKSNKPKLKEDIMRILVIDDSKTHREAAQAQLKGHDLTVVGTYDEGQRLVQKKHEFEAVLVDLLMAASRQAQGPNGRQFVGQEMPIGIFLALLAAKNGAKYVAVLTDSDHHSHPASACFDAFNAHETRPAPFTVEGAKVLLSNNGNWVQEFDPQDLSKALEYRERSDAVRAKNWATLLDYLIA